MSKINVDDVRNQRTTKRQEQTPEVKRRQELHEHSDFQRRAPATFAGIGRPDLSGIQGDATSEMRPRPARKSEPTRHRLPDGTFINISSMLNEQQRVSLESHFASLSPEQRHRLEQSAVRLGAEVWPLAITAPEGGVASASEALQSAAADTWELTMLTIGQEQRDSANESALFVGMWGAEQQLHAFLGEASARDQLNSEMRAQVSELESMIADWPDDGSTELFSYREVKINEDGSIQIIEHENVPLTKQEAIELLGKLQGQG